MGDDVLSQRGLQRMADENINSEIIEEENRSDFIEEEAIPQSSTGIIQRLIDIGNQMQEISEREEDPERKEALFEAISDELDRLTIEVQQMMDQLSSQADQGDVTEIGLEFTQTVDKQYLDASGLFLSAMEFYQNYLETEDPTFIQEALERIEMGAYRLEQVDATSSKQGEILVSTGGDYKSA